MTHRERMLAAMRGQATDQIPWAPRMDLWYTALRARGTVPERFADLNTAQIADQLQVGCHAVRADYTLGREPDDLALRALGFDNHPDYPFRVELHDLPMQFQHDAGHFQTTIETPAGQVTARLQLTRKMAADGISLPWVEKYPLDSVDDFEPVAHVFEHLKVVPTPQAYSEFHERIGDRGLAIANGPLAAAPIHLMLHDLMAMENFFVMYMDERSAMEEFAQRLEPFFEAMIDALLACEAEVVFWGANYDRDTTWPPFFKEQIVPWLQRVSRRVHEADKLLLTHTDGENRDLLPHYPECGFDIGESVCPVPMSTCTLREIREGFGSHVTAWGGIPGVILLQDSMDQRGFELYMDDLFAQLGSVEHLILGVSDNVPPDVDLSRLEVIREKIEAFGPVRG